MTIADLRKRFVWTPDGRVETYRILIAPKGPLKGDCDDFAVTALWIAEGKSMRRFWTALLTGRAVLWRVKGNGFASHMALYHRAHGWIDNQNPDWGEKRHTLNFPVLPPIVAVKMAMGKWK